VAHFLKISSIELFQSPMHEENGVSIGDNDTYLLSRTAAAVLNKARPAGRSFTANSWTNKKWFDKFVKHTSFRPEYILFARGKVNQDRWYARAISF